VIARTTGGDAADALAPLRQALQRIDPRLPPASLQTMDERMALPLWPTRTAAGLFGACGAAALLLSTIGLFGVTYFAVSARQREFGVRLALGASRADVRRLVLGEAIRLALPGIAAGALVAALLGLAGRSILFGLDTSAPAPYLVAAVVQAMVTLGASWSPAARAARSNPLAVLRGE
jgi:ABC-type antimicrobial peptide transport system permease subunit